MTDRLDEIDALLDAATPGPWERGDVWAWAGVKPEMFGPGCCAYCERMGAPVWTGQADINGTRMLAHKHRDPDPYGTDHEISAEDGLVCGNYDVGSGGVIRAEDAALIAVAPTALRDLVAAVRAAQDVDREWRERGDGGCTTELRLALSTALANLEVGDGP